MQHKPVFKLMVFSLVLGVFGCGIKGRPLPPTNNIVNLNQVQSVEEAKTDAPTSTKDSKDLKNKSRKTKK